MELPHANKKIGSLITANEDLRIKLGLQEQIGVERTVHDSAGEVTVNELKRELGAQRQVVERQEKQINDYQAIAITLHAQTSDLVSQNVLEEKNKKNDQLLDDLNYTKLTPEMYEIHMKSADELEAELTAKDKLIETLNKKLKEVETENKSKVGQLDSAEKKVKQADKIAKRYQGYFYLLSEAKKELDAQLQSKFSRVDKLEVDLAEARKELDGKTKIIADLKKKDEKIDEMQKKIDEFTEDFNDVKKASDNLSCLKKENKKLSGKVKYLEDELSRKEESIRKSNIQIKALEMSTEKAKAAHDSIVEKLKQENEKMRDKCESNETTVAQLQSLLEVPVPNGSSSLQVLQHIVAFLNDCMERVDDCNRTINDNSHGVGPSRKRRKY